MPPTTPTKDFTPQHNHTNQTITSHHKLLHRLPEQTYIFPAMVLTFSAIVILFLLDMVLRPHVVALRACLAGDPRRRTYRDSWGSSLPEMAASGIQQYETITGLGVGPRRESISNWIVGISVADGVRTPLLPKDIVDSPLEMSLGVRHVGDNVGTADKINWHGANMLNTSWGWMA